LNNVSKLIRQSGGNVNYWAEQNGFKPNTVYQVITGKAGKRRIGIAGEIVAALKRDGFLKE
jgi:gp16 family phage-associated protein